MRADVFWHALFTLIGGCLVGVVVWRILRKKRRALRAIDLASYAITLIALGSGLFSVGHYDERIRASWNRLDVFDKMVDQGFDDMVELFKVCPDIRHTPFRPNKQKADECHLLLEYLRTQQFGSPGHWNVAPLPDPTPYTVPEVRDFAQRIAAHTFETNKVILAYNAKDNGLGGADPNEALFLSIAIPLAAFALGLGISRRAVDLYNDWNS